MLATITVLTVMDENFSIAVDSREVDAVLGAMSQDRVIDVRVYALSQDISDTYGLVEYLRRLTPEQRRDRRWQREE